MALYLSVTCCHLFPPQTLSSPRQESLINSTPAWCAFRFSLCMAGGLWGSHLWRQQQHSTLTCHTYSDYLGNHTDMVWDCASPAQSQGWAFVRFSEGRTPPLREELSMVPQYSIIAVQGRVASLSVSCASLPCCYCLCPSDPQGIQVHIHDSPMAQTLMIKRGGQRSLWYSTALPVQNPSQCACTLLSAAAYQHNKRLNSWSWSLTAPTQVIDETTLLDVDPKSRGIDWNCLEEEVGQQNAKSFL